MNRPVSNRRRAARPNPVLHALRRALATWSPRGAAARRRLLAMRPQGAERETSLEMRPADPVFDRADWVAAWIDPRHEVTSADGLVTAVRGVTVQGRPIWLVRPIGGARAYHSSADDPFEAIAEGADALARRRVFRRCERTSEALREVVRDLRMFRVRQSFDFDDVDASPLCREGVEGFLRACGIPGWRRYPGWLVAWLSLLDPQVHYVIWQGHLRRVAETGPTLDHASVVGAS